MTRKIVKFILLILPFLAFAHPMPNSVIELAVQESEIRCTFKIPIKELKLATDFNLDSKNLNSKNQELVGYLNEHFKITNPQGKPWKMVLLNISSEISEQDATKKYEEISAVYRLIPTDGNLRNFKIHNDAVMHQVVSHRCMIVLDKDWANGKLDEKWVEIGVMAFDENLKTVPDFEVNLANGSDWQGFVSMVKLGMEHISEGTDHLMFLLVLIITTPLIPVGRRWKSSQKNANSFSKILKITLAFTIGHSLTLILATLGIIDFPTKITEILIAVSILISAIHAVKPIFPNKEIFVAGGFGLVHGLAFSKVLASLNLTSWRLVFSLLGFNIGIEAMQIFIILLVIPWLLFLSRYKIYLGLKNILAGFAALASLVWIVERITDKQTFLSDYLNVFSANSILFVVFLFLLSALVFVFKLKKNDA